MQSDPDQIARATLGKLPGMAAAGIWRNGVAAYGLADSAATSSAASFATLSAASSVLPSAAISNTAPLFEIGSVSKVFTGLLMAQAVERGDFSLDDNLGKLLQDPAPLNPHVAAVTVRQLLTHSSCLPRMPANFPPEDAIGNPYRSYDRAMLWSAVAALTLKKAGPCEAEYSNMGFAVLGELLSQRYGKPWAQLVAEGVTTPLGMADTLQQLGDKASRRAPSYAGKKPVSQWDFMAFAGAGALRSSAADMLTFSRAVLAGRKGPLGAAGERMLQPLGRFGGGEIGYGILMAGPPERRAYFHDGGTGGYSTNWTLLPDTQEAMIVMASNAEAPSGLASGDILALRYQAAATHMAVDAGSLPAFAGVYRIDARSAFTFVVQDGQLQGRLTGQPFGALTAAAADVFTFPHVGAEFTFRREGGKVAGVTLRQRGAMLEAQRSAEAAPAAAYDRALTEAAMGGHYLASQQSLDFAVKVERGQLMVKLNDQPTMPVFAVAGKADRYAYDVVAAEIQFERDAEGRVAALVLFQNGGTVRAQRKL